MTTAKLINAQFGLYQNVEYRITDKDGNAKRIFQENKLCRFLLQNGILSPLWINAKLGFLLRPFLGRYSDTRNIRNLVVNAGKAGMASRANGAGAEAVFTYIAMGTGVVAAAATDTALGTELAVSGLGRANSTASRVTTTVTNDTAQLQNTFTVTGSVALTESGVLNAASVGTLLARQVFTAINVVNGDNLQVTWKFQFS